MTIQSQISKKEYSKLMTNHLIKTPFMIMLIVIGIASLVFHFQEPEGAGTFYFFLGFGFIGTPVLMYFMIGQAYDRNKHFNEKKEFIMEDENFELVGQSFRSSFKWDQITKVKDAGNFFLFFQGN